MPKPDVLPQLSRVITTDSQGLSGPAKSFAQDRGRRHEVGIAFVVPADIKGKVRAVGDVDPNGGVVEGESEVGVGIRVVLRPSGGEVLVAVGFANDGGGEVLEREIRGGVGKLGGFDAGDVVGRHILGGSVGKRDDIITDFGAHVRHVHTDAPILKQIEDGERGQHDYDHDADFPGSGGLAVKRVLPGQAGALEVNRGVRLGGVTVINAVVIGSHGRMMGAERWDGKPAKRGVKARVFFS